MGALGRSGVPVADCEGYRAKGGGSAAPPLDTAASAEGNATPLEGRFESGEEQVPHILPKSVEVPFLQRGDQISNLFPIH